jgi:hypothetical protein
MKRLLVILVLVGSLFVPVRASEADAIAISERIQKRHLPFGTILDPVFTRPDGDEIEGYARAGDSAIWTGHYLAAESFRYRVTGSPDALANIRKALQGIRSLIDVTGTDLLARCFVPVNSPYAQAIREEEGRHGIYSAILNGAEVFWIGNTSRDQYSGVFFGLGVAYDFVDVPDVKQQAAMLVTRMLNYLQDRDWLVRMPNGEISTTFIGRPEQRLSFLIVGRRVNSDRFGSSYSWHRMANLATLSTGIAYDLGDTHTSYFKFNLGTINLFNLIRLESNGFYRGRYLRTYDLMRRTTDDHGNPHFNMIDYGLKGPDSRRDAATREMLQQWISRPRRDPYLDWRGDARYPPCGEERACQPLSIADRIRTDFLWQRSPFLLVGGGTGKIEGAGIDYILPYWMARYYGVIQY